MPKSYLIIHAGADSVKVMAFTQGRSEPSAFVSEPIAPKAAPADALNAALSSIKDAAGGASFEKVFVSLHPGLMSLRAVSIPFADRKKINEALPFELGGVLPFETDAAVLDSIPLGQGKALAVALEKGVLKGWLDTLKDLKIDPVWIGSAYFSTPYLLDELYKGSGITCFICKDFISVSMDGKPVFLNPHKGEAGLRLNLSYLNAESITPDKVYTTGFNPGDLKALMPGAGIEEITMPQGVPPEGFFLYALSVQIRNGLIGEAINFRRGEFAYTRDKAAVRKKLKVTGALAAVIIAALIGDFYLKYLTVSREYASYKEALRYSYQELFPDEKGPADALYQLNVKLKTIDKESGVVKGNFSVLEIMDRLAKAASAERQAGIRLNEVHMAGGRVNAGGEAASFEGANRFKEALLRDSAFKGVTIPDLKTKAGGGVGLNMTITLK